MRKILPGGRDFPAIHITVVSLLTATFIVLCDNRPFWRNLAARLPLDSFDHWRLTITLGVVLVLLFHVVFTAVSFRPLFKPFLATVLVLAAGVGYFSEAFGVVVDKSMIHNVLETDLREASELLTWPLFRHLLLYGLLPATLVVMAPLRYPDWRRGLLWRAAGIAASVALVLALFMSDFKGFVLFGRENRDLQVYLNPSYPVYALHKVLSKRYFAHAAEPLHVLAPDAVRTPGAKPSVVVLVVGETARASSLALNGYERNTTPFTAGTGVISFSDVEACGTATAESVPCMFSALGRERFSRSKAEQSENLLDVLQRTGIRVVWRDNDSGSKGVADRVAYEDFSRRKDARFCADGNCYDEVLLEELEELIRNSREDLLVVLHIKGSHGPSYYKRSPAERKLFAPECTQDNVQDCPRETIVNAYDNTIVYTDYLLGRIINVLQAQTVPAAMLYLSDHGESLGENGLYLHGLPRVLAPEEQTHVPMLFWASERFLAERALNRTALAARHDQPFSHDNLFHSMLGLFHVRSQIYRSDLDLFFSSPRSRG